MRRAPAPGPPPAGGPHRGSTASMRGGTDSAVAAAGSQVATRGRAAVPFHVKRYVAGRSSSRRRRPQLASELVDELEEGFEAIPLDPLSQSGPRDRHVIRACVQCLARPERLAQLSLDPVSLHGAAQLSRDGDADPAVLGRGAGHILGTIESVQHEQPVLRRAPAAMDAVELGGARQPRLARRLGHASGAELSAAAAAPSLDHQAPCAAGHSLAEAVLLGAAALVWLVRALHKAPNHTGPRRPLPKLRPRHLLSAGCPPASPLSTPSSPRSRPWLWTTVGMVGGPHAEDRGFVGTSAGMVGMGRRTPEHP